MQHSAETDQPQLTTNAPRGGGFCRSMCRNNRCSVRSNRHRARPRGNGRRTIPSFKVICSDVKQLAECSRCGDATPMRTIVARSRPALDARKSGKAPRQRVHIFWPVKPVLHLVLLMRAECPANCLCRYNLEHLVALDPQPARGQSLLVAKADGKPCDLVPSASVVFQDLLDNTGGRSRLCSSRLLPTPAACPRSRMP